VATVRFLNVMLLTGKLTDICAIDRLLGRLVP
jgi:hypothetical protein